jgi:hypothetical protein
MLFARIDDEIMRCNNRLNILLRAATVVKETAHQNDTTIQTVRPTIYDLKTQMHTQLKSITPKKIPPTPHSVSQPP